MIAVADFDAVKVAKVTRVACQDSLLWFTRYFFKLQQRRKFIVGDHHNVISDALERILTGKLKRLIINIAPRYGKTELAVKNFIAHGLALNAAAKFIHLSYSDSLALDNSEAVKDLVQSAEYQALFPEVKIKKDSKAKDKWYTTAGGGVLAKAAGGSVTGFGAGQVDLADDQDAAAAAARLAAEAEAVADEIDQFLKPGDQVAGFDDFDQKFKFGGAIIIDDPIKPDDADSDTIRERVNNRFDSTIRNRVNSRNTPIIVIMQRLHQDDLSGYLQRDGEADEWEVIELPCLKPDGSALWPFKHTVQELLAMEKANPVVFSRQYMQKGRAVTGLLFPEEQLRFEDFDAPLLAAALNDPDYGYGCADPANEGGDDFAGLVTKLIGNKIYVPEVVYNTDGADLNEVAIADMFFKNRLPEVGVEGVLGWVESANRVRDLLNDKDFPGDFRILRPRTNKHARILNRAAFIRNNFVFRKDWQQFPQYAKFMRNLTSYLKIQEAGKGNKHDDAPDVCEMAAVHYEKTFPHLFAIPK